MRVKILFFSLLAMFALTLTYSFCSCSDYKKDAEAHIWIYNGGFHLRDVVGFSDTLPNMYSIMGEDTIYYGTDPVAVIQSVSSQELVICDLKGKEKGFYEPLISIEKHVQGMKAAELKNIELNKAAISSRICGIITTKEWMENGNLQVKLNNNNSDFPNCFLDSPMDSLAVGDSIYKAAGENVCHIYKTNGRIVDVRFIDPNDTILGRRK